MRGSCSKEGEIRVSTAPLTRGIQISTYILNLVALEPTQGINEDPGKGSTEVDQLVHHEGHDTGGENIVLHPGIPSSPQSLGDVQIGVEFGDFLILAPVGGRGQHGGIPGGGKQKKG